MALLNRIAAETSTRIHCMRERKDEGQGTLEYVGIAVLVALIIAALLQANFGDTLKGKMDSVIEKITEGL
jgi:Flp pilus assembly pilin Flp